MHVHGCKTGAMATLKIVARYATKAAYGLSANIIGFMKQHPQKLS